MRFNASKPVCVPQKRREESNDRNHVVGKNRMCHEAFVFGWDLETNKETTRAWDPRLFRLFTFPSRLDGRWSGQDQACFSMDWCHEREKARDPPCGGKDTMNGMRRCSKRGDPSWRHQSHGRTTLFFVEGVMLRCFRFRFHGFRLWAKQGGLDVRRSNSSSQWFWVREIVNL